MVSKPDNVNRPEHYRQGGIECIAAIESALTPEEYRGYLKGNIIKYIWRERLKAGLESCQKSQWYLNRLVEFTEKNNLRNHANRVNIWGDGFPRPEMPNPEFKARNQKEEIVLPSTIGDAYDQVDGLYHHLKIQETQQ